MPEKDKFTNAMALLMRGRRKEASAALLLLYQQTTDKGFKVRLIDALLTTLDPVRENRQLVDMATEGLVLANELGEMELRAHFMGRKAEFLMTEAGSLQYQRANLKLAPGWLAFSTEAEKAEYECLTKRVEELATEIDRLLADAIASVEQTRDKRVLAFVLMSKASVESSRYLQYKVDCMHGTWETKVWLFLHRLGYEIPVLYGFNYSRTLRAYINSFAEDYLAAAMLFEEMEDDGAGYAYYDLAVHLQSAYCFRKAKTLLRKSMGVAKKYNNALLVAKIRALEASLKARNKDVPNYLEGETREKVMV